MHSEPCNKVTYYSCSIIYNVMWMHVQIPIIIMGAMLGYIIVHTIIYIQ